MTHFDNTNITPITKQANIDKTQSDDADTSAIQAAERNLDSIHNKLQLIRELVVQATDTTKSDTERHALQTEVKQLIAEISQTEERTNINTETD